jgi:hypothetical protein
MRTFLILAIFLISVPSEAQSLSKKMIRKQLHKMYKADQKARKDFLDLVAKNNPGDSIEEELARRKMTATDSANYIHLQNIFKAVGYPDLKESGGSGPSYFWLLVQHQDNHPTFQDSVLVAMKPVVDSGEVSGILYAMLLDRVRLNTGKPQVYGTQTVFNTDSNAYVMALCEDPEHVNERRKSVGLGPIEAYLESINKTYGKRD